MGAGNRFDSRVGDYSTLYFATELETCFLETLARLRPAQGFRDVIGEEWRELGFMEVGAVPADWRAKRLAVRVELSSELPFVDVEHPDTIQVLRHELADVLQECGLTDLDIGIIRGPDRRVTRAISQWTYDQTTETGADALYGGVRYFSRQERNMECWAAFQDVPLRELERRPITLQMQALRKVAKIYELMLH